MDLTGKDIRVPSGNSDVVSACAIGADDGVSKYVPASQVHPLPTHTVDNDPLWFAVAQSLITAAPGHIPLRLVWSIYHLPVLINASAS